MMTIKISKAVLRFNESDLGALTFLPEKDEGKALTVFCHGYTSHKGSLLNWATRLAESGIPSVIFDLPGHYLGTFSEADSIEEFSTKTPTLFAHAVTTLEEAGIIKENRTIILGGHSLGALLSLKAAQLNEFSNLNLELICVGLGMPPKNSTHIFQSPFYKSTLELRGQLVSPALAPDHMFDWIKKEKQNLQVKNRSIFLLSGKDDLVVGEEGFKGMQQKLQELGNEVHAQTPNKLSHHMPELAAGHIKSYLKSKGLL